MAEAWHVAEKKKNLSAWQTMKNTASSLFDGDMVQSFAISAMIGGSLLEGISAYGQGKIARKTGELNAFESYRQARDLDRQALEVKKLSKIDLYRQKRNEQMITGSQKAAIAHSGGRLDDPTSQAILKDTSEQAALDEWLIRYGANREASNLRSEANALRSRGRTSILEGKQAYSAGKIGLGASILKGFGSIFSMVK